MLLLTKPLGTGVITTAIKRGVGDPAHLQAAVASMVRLNKLAAELAQEVEVHSATDITGFGLLGHAAEIARNSGVGLRIDAAALPFLPGALDYARQLIIPAGLTRNQLYLEQGDYVRYADNIDQAHTLMLFDPQTSGGLLVVLPPAAANELERRYAAVGQSRWRIGEVIADQWIEVT